MQEIDISIDNLTECLVRRDTGETVDTEYELVAYKITSKMAVQYKKEGWNFDWSVPQRDGCEVYELFVGGDDRPQGRVAIKHIPSEYFTYLELIEAAPENIGHNGVYEGVGAHLFAIACKHSFEAGNDGYVQFEPKTKLIKYYQEKLGAKIISGSSMYLDTEAARILVDKYFGK